MIRRIHPIGAGLGAGPGDSPRHCRYGGSGAARDDSRVSRDARAANLRGRRTSLDSIAHAPQEEVIRTYMDGNMAVYTTLLTIDGHYSGEAERGQFRALVVWVRRDGRWQQVASQMTPILKPAAR
jgi:hypothetical protein